MIISEAVSGFFSGVVKPALDKWIPDAKDRLEAEQAVWKGLQAMDLGQMEVNKVEAASASLFVAGWRPYIGWVCGTAYAYTFVIQPFLVFAITAFGVAFDVTQLPKLDWAELSMVLFGILGLGSLRSWEKKAGLPSNT